MEGWGLQWLLQYKWSSGHRCEWCLATVSTLQKGMPLHQRCNEAIYWIHVAGMSQQPAATGRLHTPKVSTTPLSFPLFTSRDVEVLVMSLFYKNNLLNSFLFGLDRLKWETPLCSCGLEEQTAVHILTNCSHADETLRDEAAYHLSIGNDETNFEELGPTALLNCSRDHSFIQVCLEIVDNTQLNLRRKICLSKPSCTRPTHA